MAQAMVNFRMDKELKANMEQACKEMGLSMTTAFTIFANKVTKEKKLTTLTLNSYLWKKSWVGATII